LSRFDKYEPRVGGFRALLNAATVAGTDKGKVWAVGLNGSGKVVKGAGVTGIIGVICPVRDMVANEVIDVMTDGEIAEFTLQNGSAAAAGTKYFGVAASGDFNTTASGTLLGWTVEAGRLVVRMTGVTAVVTT
jgi:hypothetical protein